jgi:dihydrofolate synthase / folylpolyglutamate synthase
MFTHYSEALDYLYQNLPMFQRVGALAYKKDLTNTIALCEAIGNPQNKLKCIHIAGTNGKGSSSHMLASVLHSTGYKTGLYTSPHLKSFTERIRINGVEVDQLFVVDFVNRIQPYIEVIKPSFFEITVAMALDYFAREQVDLAVIEVGLGGRLDSTNIITPEVSLITNIGYDHMDILGDTLEKIASEKAGIIKAHVPVVISERQPEIEKVFKSKAEEMNAPLVFAQDEVTCRPGMDGIEVTSRSSRTPFTVHLPLKGNYQVKNLAGVVQVIHTLKKKGYAIPEDAMRKGLENTVEQTGLKGRWQQLGTQPMIICDTGHNSDGIRASMEQIMTYSFTQLHIVFGMVKDKRREEILRMLPTTAHYYFCQAKIPRALEAETLAREAYALGVQGEVVADVNEAVQKAKAMAGPDDFIFIGGSTFVVAELEGL